jgi:hypothetical protein
MQSDSTAKQSCSRKPGSLSSLGSLRALQAGRFGRCGLFTALNLNRLSMRTGVGAAAGAAGLVHGGAGGQRPDVA